MFQNTNADNKRLCLNPKCNRMFKLSLIFKQVDETPEGTVNLYFIRCPYCKTEYPAFYEDAISRRFKNTITEMRQSLKRKGITEEKQIEIQCKIKDYEVEHKIHLDYLEELYSE